MQLPRDDQQWGHIPVTGLPDGVTPVVKIGDLPWTAMTADGPDRWKVLLRGPNYTSDTQGVLVATSGAPVRVRAVSAPESASAPAGRIYLRD